MKKIALVIALLLATSFSAMADDVRDFNADTPGKTYEPFTVPEGYYQIESDMFHVTESNGTQTFEYLDPVFKYGLLPNLDIELSFNGVEDIWTKVDGKTVHQSGFGDITPKVKWNFVGNDGGWFSGALMAGVKLPTAPAPQIGNGQFEYYFVLPTQIALPDDFSIQIQEEVDVLKNADNGGKHFSYSEAVELNKNLTPDLSVSGELFAQSGTDAYSQPIYTADLGVSYTISKSVVLTAETYFGLNKYAPSIEAYSGFAFRF